MRSSTFVAILLLAAFSLVLVTLGTAAVATAVYALAIIWIAALPGLLYLQGVGGGPMPFLPYAGLYYIVFFGLPVFAAPLAFSTDGKVVLYQRIVLEPIGADVLLLAAAGVGLMIAGFYFARGLVFARMPRFRLKASELDPNSLNWLYGLLLTSSLAYRYVPQVQAIPSLGQFLDPAGYLALGGLYLQWRAGHLPRVLSLVIFVVAVPLEVYWRVRYFFLTEVLLLGGFFAFVLWRTRQLKALMLLVVAGTVIALAYSATGGARSSAVTFGGKLAAVGAYIASAATGEMAEAELTGGGTVSHDPRISRLINRVGQIWIFQHVYQASPQQVPYLGGETYRPLITSLIPRVFYPDKPQERAGAKFGYHYGFEEKPDEATSFNIPWITELLANFGPSGVLAGMAIFGVLLGFLDKVFNAPGMSDLEFLIGLTVLFRLGYQESNFSLMTGSLPALFICLYIYFRWAPQALEMIAAKLR